MESHIKERPSRSTLFDGAYYMRVGKNGRVTLPKQIRQLLKLKDNVEVEIRVEQGQVTLGDCLPTLEELAGSLPALPEGLDVAEAVRQAKLEHHMAFDD